MLQVETHRCEVKACQEGKHDMHAKHRAFLTLLFLKMLFSHAPAFVGMLGSLDISTTCNSSISRNVVGLTVAVMDARGAHAPFLQH